MIKHENFLYCSFDFVFVFLASHTIYDNIHKSENLHFREDECEVWSIYTVTGWHKGFIFYILLKFKFSHCYFICFFSSTFFWVIGNYGLKFFLWNSKHKSVSTNCHIIFLLTSIFIEEYSLFRKVFDSIFNGIANNEC